LEFERQEEQKVEQAQEADPIVEDAETEEAVALGWDYEPPEETKPPQDPQTIPEEVEESTEPLPQQTSQYRVRGSFYGDRRRRGGRDFQNRRRRGDNSRRYERVNRNQ
jgi:hypothetical protein